MRPDAAADRSRRGSWARSLCVEDLRRDIKGVPYHADTKSMDGPCESGSRRAGAACACFASSVTVIAGMLARCCSCPTHESAAITTSAARSVPATLNTLPPSTYPATNAGPRPYPEEPKGPLQHHHWGADTALWESPRRRRPGRRPRSRPGS